MAKKKQQTSEHCNFCGNSGQKVNYLINGLDAQICDACTTLAAKIVEETDKENKAEPETAKEYSFDKKPKEIVDYLDKYIIGQDLAKKVIAVAIYNHYKRIEQTVSENEVEIEKSNSSISNAPIALEFVDPPSTPSIIRKYDGSWARAVLPCETA